MTPVISTAVVVKEVFVINFVTTAVRLFNRQVSMESVNVMVLLTVSAAKMVRTLLLSNNSFQQKTKSQI